MDAKADNAIKRERAKWSLRGFTRVRRERINVVAARNAIIEAKCVAVGIGPWALAHSSDGTARMYHQLIKGKMTKGGTIQAVLHFVSRDLSSASFDRLAVSSAYTPARARDNVKRKTREGKKVGLKNPLQNS